MKFFHPKVLYGSSGLHVPRLVPLQHMTIRQIASVQCEGRTLNGNRKKNIVTGSCASWGALHCCLVVNSVWEFAFWEECEEFGGQVFNFKVIYFRLLQISFWNFCFQFCYEYLVFRNQTKSFACYIRVHHEVVSKGTKSLSKSLLWSQSFAEYSTIAAT